MSLYLYYEKTRQAPIPKCLPFVTAIGGNAIRVPCVAPLVSLAGSTDFIDMIRPGPGGSLQKDHDSFFSLPPTDELIGGKLMNHFNVLNPVTDAREFAEWHN
ncbi:hypothetical protein NOF04DRAFT_1276531 [Fusarium oxysporum II5]|nr:hypothetical protein NOF04DRAFT_1276531 [Fusarium oxysporum II5]